MHPSRSRLWCLLVSLVLGTLPAVAAPKPDHGTIELIHDTWGIPHVFSDTDAGAMYGLGHATADQHGFQMTYNLRIIQGRLAEVVGERRRGTRNESSVDHDRKMRTIGWSRAAARTAASLDQATRHLLEAYCQGVNDSFAAQRSNGKLHPLFANRGVAPELWTPADCLLSWWHLGQFFATDGTRDLMVWRNRTQPRPGQPQPPGRSSSWFDDDAAVVQREDVTEDWLKRVEEFRSTHGLRDSSAGGEGPKFSHAWVVGGKKTDNGAAVLVSDPQTPVRNPSLWMEFHLSGKTFNVRGIGVSGSPALLIGFNQRIAWGLTALGADQADLFRLETAPDHPDAYRWNGEWRKMQVRTERIKVKGGPDVDLTVRDTHLGPVVSAFSFRGPDDPEVALKRVPICEPDRDTFEGVFALMRANSAAEVTGALRDWSFPTANCVYGDAQGHIGYAVAGAIPIRPLSAPDPNGNEALPGTGDRDDWRGYVPHDLLPRVDDPKAGLLFSANHRPIGAFYRIPLGISTGSMGDTLRSWRLRERLMRDETFTARDVLDVHFDTVNPARREIVRLGLHLRRSKRSALSDDALRALDVLEKWFSAGASSDLKSDGAALATRISTFFRFVTTPLAMKHGGGESGLARFLKSAAARIDANHEAEFDDDEAGFIDQVLADAWREPGGQAGARTRAPAQSNRLAWFDSLDGFGSLDPSQDLVTPAITCLDGQTLHSQAGQSYTQWVPLNDPDSAMTICPIGHSDRPDSPWRTSTLELWGKGELHAAPLSRPAVNKITSERVVLSR